MGSLESLGAPIVAVLLTASSVGASSSVTLSLEERVDCHLAIESVLDEKRAALADRPLRDRGVLRAIAEAKAAEVLAAGDVSSELLSAELARILEDSNDQDTLASILRTLRHEPLRSLECLARPLLVDRIKAGLSQEELESSVVSRSGAASRVEAGTPSIQCPDDSWQLMSTTLEPSAREDHSAVWTGVEMIIWGGVDSNSHLTRSGALYSPATDSWSPTEVMFAPNSRLRHQAFWTGTEMLIWGGTDGASQWNGSLYDPVANSWRPMTTTGAPSARLDESAVWTGTEMIVWGGVAKFGSNTNDGGRYDPSIDVWTSTTTVGAPEAQAQHIAVWTGSEMVIWGVGAAGARYDPVDDSWSPISQVGAPAERAGAIAVWSGNGVIVWGGYLSGEGSSSANDGFIYDPVADQWFSISTVNGPLDVADYNAFLWTGHELVVWGYGTSGDPGEGRLYSPRTDVWTPVSLVDAPQHRIRSTAVWTDLEAVIWGGKGFNSRLAEGGRYCRLSPIFLDGFESGDTMAWDNGAVAR